MAGAQLSTRAGSMILATAYLLALSAGQSRKGFLPTVPDSQHGVEPGDAEHFRRHGLQGTEGQLAGTGLERLDEPQDALSA